MALDNIFTVDVRPRWVIAFGFGLVYGFGFSFALRQTLQFAGTHLLTSVLSFNVGVELGQLFVLVILVAALTPVFRYAGRERLGVIVPSALVCHTGWHWMIDRAAVLTTMPWPLSDLVEMTRWATAAALAASAAVFLVGIGRRVFEMHRRESPTLEATADEHA